MALADADAIILSSLDRLGCKLEGNPRSIADLGADALFRCAVTCLDRAGDAEALDVPSVDGRPSLLRGPLPSEPSLRFRACAQLAAAVERVGYPHAVGFNDFLVANPQGARRILTFLLERCAAPARRTPRRGRQRTAFPGDARDEGEAQAAEAVEGEAPGPIAEQVAATGATAEATPAVGSDAGSRPVAPEGGDAGAQGGSVERDARCLATEAALVEAEAAGAAADGHIWAAVARLAAAGDPAAAVERCESELQEAAQVRRALQAEWEEAAEPLRRRVDRARDAARGPREDAAPQGARGEDEATLAARTEQLRRDVAIIEERLRGLADPTAYPAERAGPEPATSRFGAYGRAWLAEREAELERTAIRLEAGKAEIAAQVDEARQSLVEAQEKFHETLDAADRAVHAAAQSDRAMRPAAAALTSLRSLVGGVCSSLEACERLRRSKRAVGAEVAFLESRGLDAAVESLRRELAAPRLPGPALTGQAGLAAS